MLRKPVRPSLSTIVIGILMVSPFIAASMAAKPTPPPAPAPPPSTALAHRIEQRLAQSPATQAFDIDVAVDDGTVTLAGVVASEAARREAERLAAIDGIAAVDDTLVVRPAPSADALAAEDDGAAQVVR